MNGSAAAPERRVLILDSDSRLRAALADFLRAHDFDVAQCSDGAELERLMTTATTDLVLLEVGLEAEDGFAVLRRLTTDPKAPPVIVLSRLTEITDRIVGLELGADDYLAKPVEPRELLARVRAVLRRAYPASRPVPEATAFLAFSGWRLDARRGHLTAPAGGVVHLSNHELSLLEALVATPHRILTRTDLAAAMGAAPRDSSRVVDITVSRLRRKMRQIDPDHELVRTVRNLGYIFLAETASPGRP